ncbi:MAG: hypothetical protein ACTSXJ_10595 [Candidatus Baldrarchaeia archaeon]
MGEEETPRGAILLGFLFLLTGFFLISAGASRISEYVQRLMERVPGHEHMVATLGGTSSYMLILYGVLAVALAIGFFQKQEWAAGGGFVLLIIALASGVLSIWEQVVAFGGFEALIAEAPLSTLISMAACAIMALMLVYMVVAKGWR